MAQVVNAACQAGAFERELPWQPVEAQEAVPVKGGEVDAADVRDAKRMVGVLGVGGSEAGASGECVCRLEPANESGDGRLEASPTGELLP